ncbi:arabinofuranosyltransferase [Nonomuraea sp. NBC_01738]|uniref:arabinofuranosyltransferase n=1 Tax=Nonomuraea sp. NBC_01738 TaxID=2976003 RepID=UPI002E0E73D4|nr:arabinofuranosyltransferase [Nonomuraea sp. NBC_01738]
MTAQALAAVERSPATSERSPRRSGGGAGWVWAPVAWAVTTAGGFAVVAALNPDPFTLRGAFLPLPALGLLSAVLLLLAWRFSSLSPVVCGVFAGWVAFALRVVLNGTPFGFAGLYGDMGRVAAAATRYTVTPWSADAFVEEIPAEYPPLYPWLIGRASVLTGIPAWKLVGEAEILTTSATIVAAYLLWSRLVRPPVALAIAAAGLVAFGDPRKAFVVAAAQLTIPWVILTFGSPPRGRLTWWAAGLIGGLMVVVYQGFLIYGAFGMVVVAGFTWWRSADRWRYLAHLLGVANVALAVSAWYVVPYVIATVRYGGQQVADLYESADLALSPFPFLQPTPLGALQLAGLAGIVLYRRREWWAAPLLTMVAGLYLYRVLMMTRFVLDGHTGFFHYTSRLLGPLLAAAGVLTLVALARRRQVRGYGVAALAVVLVWSGVSQWRLALPERVEPWAGKWPASHVYTRRAHEEPLPGGARTHPSAVSWFPATQVRDRVASVLGEKARPRTLSYDERLFAYLPWRGYVAVERTSANTLTRWDDRHAELARLAAISDPAEFARASATTRFGAIDVFVLKNWRWNDITFRPEQFTAFHQFADLPQRTVLLIRK